MTNKNYASGSLNVLSDGYSLKVTALAENPNRWIALYMIPENKKNPKFMLGGQTRN